MKKMNQQGAANAWLIAFVLTLVLLLGAVGFGFAMFSSRQDYKDNVDGKVAEAVQVAEQKLTEKKEAEFTEREKQPLKVYPGPEAYGSLKLSYPKTWAAYIDESGKGSNPLDGYLNPSFVPGVQANPTIALRFQVMNTSYATAAKNLEPQVKAGKIKTTPFVAPKVAGVTGVRADGEIVSKKSGSMILLPLRDKTLKIWTESPQFIADFNDIIMANVTFIP